jgi:potassium-transporting ATPase potassium-binding subunit
MTLNGWLQIALYCALVLVCVKPLGAFMARLFAGERTFLHPVIAPVERVFYRVAGVDPTREQHWTTYTVAMLVFNALGFFFLYALQRLQHALPLNPQGFDPVSEHLAFNTAVSFVTNTNWQSYGGESTMSYLVQMLGLTVQNYLSAATGIALAIALTRAFARAEFKTVGNFWADMTRATLYVLLPMCVIISFALIASGMPQNLHAYVDATTLEGAQQTIAQGPVASQVAIKQLGTNGGGFFNSNSAHPYENPNAITNLIEMWAIFVIGAALTYTFGRMVGDQRQGWTILGAMGFLFLAGVLVAYWAEAAGNPLLTAAGADTTVSDLQPGGNMEGKEIRFGIVNSALWAVVTTAASCGAVNAMHDSFTALGGLVPLFNMELGEIIIGGVGAGLYGMLLFAILAVFIAGLMVGRTPEYLGKKIEAKEVKMTMLAILILPASALGFAAVASVLPSALASLNNQGPHGFSEILYAYASATGNNGSAFAGLNANTPFYDTTLGLAMLIGRFAMIVPMMAVAGALTGKKRHEASSGTFPTHTPLFIGLLVGVILIVGGLTYFPALSLGPIVEHFLMQAGKTF